MKSPFPGMDPYLEPHWLDVHTKLVTYSADELNALLPASLVARTEERVSVESSQGDLRSIGPDVRVFSPASDNREQPSGGISIEAPFALVIDDDPVIERFIRILDDAGNLVTVIEFVSPTNKRQPELDAYRQMRAELLTSNVSLVEVDLVRAGDWRALMRPERCLPKGVSLYRVTVRIAGRLRGGYLFPVSLRLPLPQVPIPLRSAEPPVKLDLQTLLTRLYENGRYASTVDYRRPLDPPLAPDDAEWARHAAEGRREAVMSESRSQRATENDMKTSFPQGQLRRSSAGTPPKRRGFPMGQ